MSQAMRLRESATGPLISALGAATFKLTRLPGAHIMSLIAPAAFRLRRDDTLRARLGRVTTWISALGAFQLGSARARWSASAAQNLGQLRSGGARNSVPRPAVAAAPMSEAERRRERAMSLGVGTDVLLCTPMLGIAIWSGSLTLLADAMRACLLTLMELFAYVVMRRIHRGRLPSYQYGSGKIESFLNLLIGIALVLSGVWIFALGVLSLLQPPQPSPFGFAVAAATGAVNTTQNAWMFATFLGARRLGASILIDGQVRTRVLKVVSSASATLAILVSAIFAGEVSGRIADLVGSAIVIQMMLWTAYQLIAGALPDLTDRMLDPSLLTQINRVLLCNLERIDAIHHVRTRRCGVMKYIEIGVGFAADRRMGEINAINQSLKKLEGRKCRTRG